jgi:predicted RecB family nuclease
MDKIPTIDLGEKRWQGIWVSKNDIVEFLRCRYRVYLSHVRGIPVAELKDNDAIRAIIEKGIQFESTIISEGQFQEVQLEKDLDEFIHKDLVLHTPMLFRNHELGIQGIPDLINAGKGRLYPVEIKTHRKITEADELELAFYWRLLEPYRKGNPKAKGYLILGAGEMVEINLSKDHLFEICWLADEVRDVKNNGAEPTLSPECKLCTLIEDCKREVSQRGGLSLIHGIAYIREQQLKSMGITNITDLMKVDSAELHERWYATFGNTPGISEINRMQLHALSLVDRKPVFFGELESFRCLDRPLIIVDLEYDPGSYIWLVGLYIMDKQHKKIEQYFAERFTPVEEKRIIEELLAILKFNPKHVVITYGASADMPQLEKAWRRHGFPANGWSDLQKRHVDLYAFMLRNFRFPLSSYSLKDVEGLVGFQRNKERIDGLIALGMYNQYLREKKEPQKSAIKQELLEYNKEDLEGTAFVARQLKPLLGECIRK